MDGENIVYIIIGVVYFIASILNSRKKKREKAARQKRAANPNDSSTPPPVPRGKSFEEMLSEMFNVEEAEPQPQQTVSPPPPQPSLLMREDSDTRRLRQKAEHKQETKDRKDKQTAHILQREQHMIKQRALANAYAQNTATVTKNRTNRKLKMHKNISARDAIIGKIILDRPYI